MRVDSASTLTAQSALLPCSSPHGEIKQIQVLLKGRARHPGGHEVYLQYLEHLRLKLFPVPEQVLFCLFFPLAMYRGD